MLNDTLIRALVVDDSILTRRVISAALGTAPDITVVGTASNGTECLAAVEQHGRADRVGGVDDLAPRRAPARHVRHVGERDHPRARPEQGAVGVEVQRPVVTHGHELQHAALAFAQEMPGDQVGVVLQLADHDLVAGLERQAEA